MTDQGREISQQLSLVAAEPVETVFSRFRSRSEGLTNEESAERLRQNGRNEIASHEVRAWNVFFRQFASSFVYLLVAAGALAMLLREYIDGSAIFLFVLVNAFLGFFQEYRSEQTVRTLKKYVVRRAKVRRDGEEIMLDSAELVTGDIVLVETGDVVPADLRFFEDHSLQINESVLTGESVSVYKTSKPIAQDRTAGRFNIGLSGTTVVDGWGTGIVIAAGSSSMLGDVAHLTAETTRESGFEKRLSRFSTFILRLTVVTLVFVFLANLVLRRGSISVVELVIFSIALAVSVIPEALPVVTTFSLSRGALHLAKNKVVVKRLSAIEDLGSIEVLCTDKTGTLTENTLTVSDVLSKNRRETLFAAVLGSSFLKETEKEPNNAFDRALWQSLSETEKTQLRTYSRDDEMPFDPDRRRNSVLVSHDGEQTLVVRGAPETILPATTLRDDERRHIEEWVSGQGRQGHRVLSVGRKARPSSNSYTEQDETTGLEYLGTISFVDPIKPTTIPAIQKAQSLGVRIKILTGDGPDVAGAVAQEVGLAHSYADVMTGTDLEALPQEEQHEAVNRLNVFARVSPQQKFHIIRLLEEQYEVGFLGEGINDAPALKAANVALVVNDAADVAREAADIVLLQKSLQVIVDGIREGRQVFANTVKYIKATLGSNFGNFYAIAIASLLIDFLPMLPLQILLLNLLSDFPMIAVATDSVDDSELRRPKGYHVRDIALFAMVLGGVSSVFDFLYFGIFVRTGAESLQTYWFMGSILTELLFLFSVRTRGFLFKAKRPSAMVLWLSGVAAALTIAIPFFPFGKSVFHFITPNPLTVLLVVGIALIYLAISEFVKIQYYRYTARKNAG